MTRLDHLVEVLSPAYYSSETKLAIKLYLENYLERRDATLDERLRVSLDGHAEQASGLLKTGADHFDHGEDA